MIQESEMPDDCRVLNCAGCGALLMGRSMIEMLGALSREDRKEWPPVVAGRVRDRPYCHYCMRGPTQRYSGVGRGESGDAME